MAEGGILEEDLEMEELINSFNTNPRFKLLKMEEYNSLLANQKVNDPGIRVRSSTPRTYYRPPQFSLRTPDMFASVRSPGVRGPARPQLRFPTPRPGSLGGLNQTYDLSMLGQYSNPPKLPTFSGSEEPQKNEVSYDVWSFEVGCLKKAHIPEYLLLQSIHSSLKGIARSMLVPLGETATVQNILDKLDGFYGNVSTSETLMQNFYSEFQKDSESIVTYGSRLEQILSKAIKDGHIDESVKDSMLRSKF